MKWMKILLISLILFTVATSQERKIKAGDTIEIVVYGHQELSRTVTVNPQGAIDFPFMQSLPVDGLTMEKLREIVVAQLSRYLNTYPVVTVGFSKTNTFYVQILGMVRNPGLVPIPLGSTLQGAIGAAGGTLPTARLTDITVYRNQDGKVTTNSYDLESFLLQGDMKQNPLLTEGDVVMVIGNMVQSTVKVIGEVRSPGSFENFAGATIFDMILLAGGPAENANMSSVRYISPSRKKALEYKINLNKFFATGEFTQLPVVKSGDMIYVPKKKNYWRSILEITRDVSTISLALWYIMQLNAK